MANVLDGLLAWYRGSKENKGYKVGNKKKTTSNKKAKKNKKNSKSDKKREEQKENPTAIKIDDENNDKSIFAQETIVDLVAPNGVNPNPLGYLTVNDEGRDVYIRSFYIDKLPRRSTFAHTFEEIFNFSNSTVSIFIEPLIEGKSIKELDKQITSLDSERLIAQENKDRNRERKVDKKLNEAEAWASNIDSGENTLFEVGFLITIFADSLDELDVKSGDLHSLGKSKGIELSACFAHNPEAFLANTPINKPDKKRLKYHQMDKFSLSTIFNHTRSEFYHEDGVVIGRNMNTGKPITYDIYDKSHNGYGVVITGTTNAGKSTTVKVLVLRYAPFGYRFVSLDTEQRGNRGEYSMLAEQLNGVNYQIHSKSNNTINLFEIGIEKEFDEIDKVEYEILNLSAKITDVKHIILTMVRNGKSNENEIDTFIERIVTDIINELYDERKIYDGDIDSLFTNGTMFVNGKVTSGKVKKELPAITDFCKRAFYKKKKNKNPNYDLAIDIIIATMEDYVRELIICPDCLKTLTLEEYMGIKNGLESHEEVHCPHCKEGEIKKIKGIKPYYDGQSTIEIDYYTKYTNIDISQLHDKDKPIAQQIALNFIKENFIKKNSKDPTKAEKLVVLFDETHKMFPYKEAREFIVEVYRTARKRHVSPWTATQRLADYALYDECIAIITNATSKFLLRHDAADQDVLMKHTSLTSSQAERTLSLDKGEVVLIDNNHVVFVKIDLLDIEKMVTETDMGNVRKMYEGKAVS